MSTEEQTREQALSIINAPDMVVLTYTDEQGRLVSSPMANKEVTDLGEVYLLTETDTDKALCIGANPSVNLHYATGTGWVSLSGSATVQTDPAKLKELWDSGAEAWMPEGPDSPKAGYFHVRTDTIKYWDAPGRPAMAVQFLKGLVSDERPDMGDEGVITP